MELRVPPHLFVSQSWLNWHRKVASGSCHSLTLKADTGERRLELPTKPIPPLL